MKRIWILGIIVVIVLGIIIIPKLIYNEGDSQVKFTAVDERDIPRKINEILPRYKMEERALSCKIGDEVYVVVTRGEKRTEGYSVTIDKITKVKTDEHFNLVVYADYKDPSPDQIVAQVLTYPFTIVKTDLKELPKQITLEVEYEE